MVSKQIDVEKEEIDMHVEVGDFKKKSKRKPKRKNSEAQAFNLITVNGAPTLMKTSSFKNMP